jgi:hypothetical protein
MTDEIEKRCVSEHTAVRLAKPAANAEGARGAVGHSATLNKDQTYYRIRVSVAGTVRLAAVVKPCLLPELRYTLPQVTP